MTSTTPAADWLNAAIDHPGITEITEDKTETETPTVRTWRVQYTPGSSDGDTETYVRAEGHERTVDNGHAWIAFHRDGRTVAQVREGNVIVVEEVEPLTDRAVAGLTAAIGHHPADPHAYDRHVGYCPLTPAE